MTLLSPLYPGEPIDVGSRLNAFVEGDALGGTQLEILENLRQLPGWQILHTPGHTPGHVSFFRPSDRTLLVDDAFCTTKPESFFEAAIAQHPELHGPPAYFTSNWEAARSSVGRLADLNPNILAPGHGKPLAGPDAASALRLSANFDDICNSGKRAGLTVRVTTIGLWPRVQAPG
jgi:glyoxylase-like metal-dependent hydrolase (beta-lactamase superfamily II)